MDQPNTPTPAPLPSQPAVVPETAVTPAAAVTPAPVTTAVGETAPEAPPDAPMIKALKEALREVYDPEIPINILDLGLIYRMVEKDGTVDIDMTLTSPHCPVGEQLRSQASAAALKVPGVKEANVQLVFDPPWDKDKMTFEGKLQGSMLGFM